MAIELQNLEKIIKDAFPDARFMIKDLVGDNDHYYLEISSEQFRGKRLIDQHRMVTEALETCLGTTLHALQIKTSVPPAE
ncbi:Transcriptional regulator BolA [Rickettsiales bacterium Ac37b]|nr:Transcriptional regulator BolA [Rickettsiales bacterium Ac37b]